MATTELEGDFAKDVLYAKERIDLIGLLKP